MHDALTNQVGGFLSARGLLRPDVTLVAAVSGGPDSLCLLHILAGLSRSGGPRVHVAHLDHRFRGDQSAAEARLVAETAAAWGLPATVAAADVPARARARRESAQAAARAERYAFLADVARSQGARAVAVAHHADDQAETVLLHTLRGAGPAGLRGMRPEVPWEEWAPQIENVELRILNSQFSILNSALLIRPLLETPRAAILAYCADHGLAPADDPSNRSERYARSRVRHRLLPALAAHNPQVVGALGRTAQICADDYDFIQAALEGAWPTLASEEPGGVRIDLARWRGLHPSLQRYTLRRAAGRLGGAELSYAQVEAARAAMSHDPPRPMPLARGLLLEFGYNSALVRLAGAPPSPEAPQLAAEALALAGGHTPLGGGWACLVRPEPPPDPTPWWVAVPAELAGRLSLRRRRPGDRIRPAGGRGSRSLQDLFVDRKVPRALRGAWPVLVVGEAVLWVAGLRADEAAAAHGPAGAIWVGIVREEE